ncbi:MAG: trehalose-6-phosphate synthase [Sulfurimonas sp.]|nr:trehalose-6-phosphate synthase [Sulfurimonas sp.]
MQDLKKSRLIIASNRLPVILKKSIDSSYKLSHASGGLVTAMTPVLKKYSGVWVGWAGNYLEEDVGVNELLKKEEKDLNYKYRPVDISLNDYELYYKGFSNETLWPLFHNMPGYCTFKLNSYKAYQKVNKIFAITIMKNLMADDFIWIHDYHLINTAIELRKSGIKNNMAFFLHIPFPPLETFNRMPWRVEIITALLSYDLIGFHTELDKNNFLEVIEALIEDAVFYDKELDITTVVSKNTRHKVGVFPISIDYNEFSTQAESKEVTRITNDIKSSYAGEKFILGIDRLDYSKGIPQRLRAYRSLLAKNPKLRTKIKLMQIMIPSREDIDKYSELKSEIEELIGEINGKFSQLGWIPIQYSYDSLSRTELLAYYRASEIALVTPLKDGMNLIAKEYCAANIDKDGVLILSEFAGAKCQFKDDALIVNPYDEESVVNTIKKALSMKAQEKRKRMENMQNNIKKFDVFWWVDSFLKAVKK